MALKSNEVNIPPAEGEQPVMRTRKEWETFEEQFLASYAQKSSASRGRCHAEDEHPYRALYQRDRDRIIHSRAFRRLQYKTQVFVNHEGDHYRTRLTHTTEVAQISRSCARAMRLNEDLAEAIALAHDLGHPPFGHAGESALNELMKDHGGFEHNQQSLRIVDKLEKRYPNFDGLNLTWEVRDGLMKHRTEEDMQNGKVEGLRNFPSLEGQLADLGDEIAYNAHDIDDGLSSKYLSAEELQEVPLVKDCFNEVESTHGKNLDPDIRGYYVVRTLINKLATDAVTHTLEQLKKNQIKQVQDVRNFSRKLVTFSPTIAKQENHLKQFLMAHLYTNYQVEIMHEKGHRILKELFTLYCRNPKILPPSTQTKLKESPLVTIVCDYVAGMTDRFAINEYRRLCDLSEKI